MKTRPPHRDRVIVEEPDSHPIYVKLGMTKGAFAAFVLSWTLIAVLVAIGWTSLRHRANENHRLAVQNRALTLQVRHGLSSANADRAANRLLVKRSLRQLCDANNTGLGQLADGIVVPLNTSLRDLQVRLRTRGLPPGATQEDIDRAVAAAHLLIRKVEGAHVNCDALPFLRPDPKPKRPPS